MRNPLLPEALSLPWQGAQADGPRVARVVAEHPALRGVYAAQSDDLDDSPEPFWIRATKGVALVRGDRVVIGRARGLDEPFVLAVLDGPAEQDLRPLDATAAFALRGGECLRVTGPDGAPLFELAAGPAGPELRVVGEGLSLAVRGKLSLSGSEVEIKARAGSATLEASDEVHVRGERINLN